MRSKRGVLANLGAPASWGAGNFPQKKEAFLAAQPRTGVNALTPLIPPIGGTGNCVVDLLFFLAVTNDVAG